MKQRTLLQIKLGKRTLKITVGDVVVFKTIVAVGILSMYFLPGHIAGPVTAGANLLWLWKG